MTLEECLDRESILKTVAQYTLAGDRLRADESIATFTDNAIPETDPVSETDHFCPVGKAPIHPGYLAAPSLALAEGRPIKPDLFVPICLPAILNCSQQTQPISEHTEQPTLILA